MANRKLLSFDFFQSFHSNDAFYEKITDETQLKPEILKHLVLVLLFSIIYGAIMGSYNSFWQAVSSAIKMPVLILLIVVICFPAFYVIQTVLGSRLSLGQMISIILSGFVFMTCIMVSFSTIVLFFMITGSNYNFLKLLHVLIIVVAGFFGMRAIVEALKYSCEKKSVYPKTGVYVFRIWIFILAFVGAQLSWSLRPFIGAKDAPFEVVRQKYGNFYVDVLQSMGSILVPAKKAPEK
ncbi:MAG TPA: actin-binding WH2 domain-containing protein [Acidobacteriota bacterium]|nr:actin-binding WH2 domain-containing protein [Acidobacteriota bacterium]